MAFKQPVMMATVALLALGAMPAAARERPPIKTIAVISDLGDHFTVKHIGFMVFSNAEATIDVSDWKTDGYVNALAAKAMSGQFGMKQATFEKGSIASDKTGTYFSRKDTAELLRDNAKTADGQPVDAYLVAVPAGREVGMTNQIVDGLGLLTWGGSADIYTAIEYELIDGKTFDRIDYCHPQANDGEQGREKNMWKHPEFPYEKASDIPSDDMPKIEEATKHALDQGLAYCLRDMKLVP